MTSGPRVVADSWPAGTLVLNEFVVERELGSGSNGVVYLVRSERTGLRLALKRVSALAADRLLGEVQAASAMGGHPNILSPAFFRRDADHLLLFLPYADGGSLAELVASGSLDVEDPDARTRHVLDLCVQIARGLGALHAQGFVHQDFNPRNVLLTSTGDALVADFGLATHHGKPEWLLDFMLTHVESGPSRDRAKHALAWDGGVNTHGSTRPYAAPEQIRRGPATPASDVFGWGCMLLEMTLGEREWTSGPDATEVLERVLRDGHRRRSSLTPPLVRVLRRALFTSPQQRFQDGSDAARALVAVFEAQFGDYERELRPTVVTPFRGDARMLGQGISWQDPSGFLSLAVAEGELAQSAADAVQPQRSGTPLEQTIADLSAYEAACTALDEAVLVGKSHLVPHLALAHANRALIHQALADWNAATEHLDHAVQLFDNYFDDDALDASAAFRLEYVWLIHARSLLSRHRGQLDEALWWAERSLALANDLAPSDGRTVLLVSAALSCANIALSRGDASGAARRLDLDADLTNSLEPLLRAKVAIVRGAALAETGATQAAAVSFAYGESVLDASDDDVAVETLRLQLAIRRAGAPSSADTAQEAAARLSAAVTRALSQLERFPDLELAAIVGESCCKLGVLHERLGQRAHAAAVYVDAIDALMELAMASRRPALILDFAPPEISGRFGRSSLAHEMPSVK